MTTTTTTEIGECAITSYQLYYIFVRNIILIRIYLSFAPHKYDCKFKTIVQSILILHVDVNTVFAFISYIYIHLKCYVL